MANDNETIITMSFKLFDKLRVHIHNLIYEVENPHKIVSLKIDGKDVLDSHVIFTGEDLDELKKIRDMIEDDKGLAFKEGEQNGERNPY